MDNLRSFLELLILSPTLLGFALDTGKQVLFRWQEFAGAIVGVVGAFGVWWFSQLYIDKRDSQESIATLHRILVDRINSTLEAYGAIQQFLDDRLQRVIDRVKARDVYSVESTYFPEFATNPLSKEGLRKLTGSAYVDSKVDRAYSLSEDLPEIYNDLRTQLVRTIDVNKELAFIKANSEETHNASYAANLEEFARIVREDLLGKSLPIYMRALVEAQVVVRELRDTGISRWNFRFHPKYHFFWNAELYKSAAVGNSVKMDNYFEPAIEETLVRVGISGRKPEERLPQE